MLTASEALVTRIAQFDSHFINFSMPVLVCTVGANHAICVLALRTLRHFNVQSGLDCVLERPRPRLKTVNLGLACQRHLKNASARRSKSTSVMLARRPPNWGPFRQASGLGGIIRRRVRAGTA